MTTNLSDIKNKLYRLISSDNNRAFIIITAVVVTFVIFLIIQSLKWFNSEVKNRIIGRIEADAEITKLTTELGDAVFTGEITPERAIDTVLSTIIKNKL